MKTFKLKWNEQKAKARLKQRIDKVIESSNWKEEGSKYVTKQIQGKTRLEKIAKTGAGQKTISEQHQKNKERLAKKNKTGTSFGASKSNLTITGQLLKSLKREDDKRLLIVKPDGDRKPYTLPSGKQAKDTPTNEELAGYLKDMGYEFMGLSEKMKKNLKKIIIREFNRTFYKK